MISIYGRNAAFNRVDFMAMPFAGAFEEPTPQVAGTGSGGDFLVPGSSRDFRVKAGGRDYLVTPPGRDYKA